MVAEGGYADVSSMDAVIRDLESRYDRLQGLRQHLGTDVAKEKLLAQIGMVDPVDASASRDERRRLKKRLLRELDGEKDHLRKTLDVVEAAARRRARGRREPARVAARVRVREPRPDSVGPGAFAANATSSLATPNMRPAAAEATVHTREPRSPEAVDDLLARARAAVATGTGRGPPARRPRSLRPREPSLAGYGNGGYFLTDVLRECYALREKIRSDPVLAGDDGRPEEPPSPPKSRENSPVGRLDALRGRRRRRHRRRPKSAPSSVSDHLLKTTASSSVKNVGRRESRHRHAVNNWFSASHAYKADAPKLDKRTRSETIRDGDGRGFLQTTTESAGRDVHSRERMESMITRENANWFSPSSKTKAVAAHGDAPPSPDRSPESRSRPRSAARPRQRRRQRRRGDDDARAPQTQKFGRSSPFARAPRPSRLDPSYDGPWRLGEIGWFRIPEDKKAPKDAEPRFLRVRVSSVHLRDRDSGGGIGSLTLAALRGGKVDIPREYLRGNQSAIASEILRRGGRISEVLRVTAEAYERREQRANAAKTMQRNLRILCGVPKKGDRMTLGDAILRYRLHVRHDVSHTIEEEDEEEEASAATRMQAIMRARRDREAVKGRHAAAAKLQRLQRKRSFRRKRRGSEFRRDAELRGRGADFVSHDRDDALHLDSPFPNQETAARALQARLRGDRARKDRRREHAGASRLQARPGRRSRRRRGRGSSATSRRAREPLRRRRRGGARAPAVRVGGPPPRVAAAEPVNGKPRAVDVDEHRRELAALDAADEDARARRGARARVPGRARAVAAGAARRPRRRAHKHARRSVVEQRQALAEALMDVEGSRRQAEEALAAERAAAAAARDEQNRDHAAKVLFYEEELKAAAWRAAQQRELEATLLEHDAARRLRERDAAVAELEAAAAAARDHADRAELARQTVEHLRRTAADREDDARAASAALAEVRAEAASGRGRRRGRGRGARAAALEDAAEAAAARADAEARAAALEEAREAAVARARGAAALEAARARAAEADEARAEAGAERAKREALEAEKDALEAARRDAVAAAARADAEKDALAAEARRARGARGPAGGAGALKAAAASPDPRRERPPAEAPVPAVAAATPLPRDRGAFETPYAEPPSATSQTYTPAFEPEGTPAAGPAPAPDDWEELFDDAEGRAYYWSKARDESRWDKPACLVTLYSDWEKHFDAASQHYYYYSESRGESTWDAPEPTRRPGGATPTPRKWTPAKNARPTPSRRLP
ncbi:N-acetyl-beta-D-galactosaminidase [Aureococcus anophagefferens]|nr:N-acetyl-beta-D-galactosaminidase [Aureococcus anophagefferens]